MPLNQPSHASGSFAGEFDLQGVPALARRGNCRFGAKGKICTACTDLDFPQSPRAHGGDQALCHDVQGEG